MKIKYVVGRVTIKYEGSFKEFAKTLSLLTELKINQPEDRRI